MTREEIDLIPIEFKARLKLFLNLGMPNEIAQKIPLQPDRDRQKCITV